MMTTEERKVLVHLHRHGPTSVSALSRVCLSGLPTEWVQRILGDLEWLGYVTAYGDVASSHAALQLTEKGRHYLVRPRRAVLR